MDSIELRVAPSNTLRPRPARILFGLERPDSVPELPGRSDFDRFTANSANVEESMVPKRFLGLALATLASVAAISFVGDAEAQGKKGKTTAPAAPAAEPPDTKKPIVLTPDGLSWGMTSKQVAAVIDKMLDEVYRPLYQKVSPGVKMKALDAALAEEKSAFLRSIIEFGKLPTGVDATPLKGEYTYKNGESMMAMTREGQTRYFFFMKGKLWKIIDEVKLGETAPLGATFVAAATKLAETYGVAGRVLEPDFAIGRNSQEVDWKDAKTHLRAIARSDTALALAYEDLGTLSNLSTLRANKHVEEDAIDPAVAAAMAGAPSEPAAPPKPKR
jgi:hypothetical protein